MTKRFKVEEMVDIASPLDVDWELQEAKVVTHCLRRASD